MLLSREAILGADDIQTETVDVPEWGGAVRLRVMSGRDREAYLRLSRDKDGNPQNFLAALIVATAVDDEGRPVFGAKDVEALSAKNGTALGRVWEAAARLNGLTQASVEKTAGE